MTMNNNSSLSELSDLSTVNCQLSTKKVAIVILNWNGCKLMEKFLPSVIDYSPSEPVSYTHLTLPTTSRV